MVETKKNKNTEYYSVVFIMLIAMGAFYGFKSRLPNRLFSEQVKVNSNIVVDSLMLQAMADTTHLAIQQPDTIVPDNEPVRVEVPKMTIVDGSFDPTISVSGYQNLTRFYSKLKALEDDPSAKVRVAYFGDSMNDGDLIVQDVRSQFQTIYGGKGVGFVAITSLSAGARGTVRHQHSNNWLAQSFVKVKQPFSPFGLDGQVFFTKTAKAWVKYRAQGYSQAESLYSPTLFYGKSDNDSASLVIKSGKLEETQLALTPKYLLNKLKLSRTIQDIEIQFQQADSIPFYGLNFDDGKGIHIDNFSIRGNSGLPLSVLNTNLMNAFDRSLGYDLIILQYGANVLSNTTKSYAWYDRNMTVAVNHLQICFPNADILVLSTADKSSMIDEVMQTDPAVALLAIAQRNYARKTGSGYINLYHLMGGEDSMVEWVDNNLANKDYTHFNASGSRKIGKLIFEEIMVGYKKFKGTIPATTTNNENIE